VNEDGGVSARSASASLDSRPEELIGINRFSATQFLVALVMLIFATPFIDQPPYGEQIEAVVMTVVLLSGALAVGGRRRILILSLSLSVTAVILKWVQHFQPQIVPGFLVPAVSLLFMGLLIYELTRFIMRAPQVDREVVCASISTYISMGLAWTFAYVLVSRLHPESFAKFGQPLASLDAYDAFYFSYTTLLTIGYGDFTPLTRVAKMLVILEGMTGMLYVVTLISRLVSIYSASRLGRH